MAQEAQNSPASSTSSGTSAGSQSSSGQTSAAKTSEKPSSKPAAKKAKTPAKKTAARKTVAKKKTARKPAAKKAAPTTTKRKTTRRTAAKKTVKSAPKTTAAKQQGINPFENVLKAGGSFFDLKPNNKPMEKIMAQGKNQMDKMAQEAANAGRENMEACIKSGSIWMKGCEDIMRTCMSLAQNSADKQAKYIKEALSSKTLNEWAECQSKIAQACFDDCMSGATKISEMSVKVLSEAIEPVNNQATKTIQKASESIAA